MSRHVSNIRRRQRPKQSLVLSEKQPSQLTMRLSNVPTVNEGTSNLNISVTEEKEKMYERLNVRKERGNELHPVRGGLIVFRKFGETKGELFPLWNNVWNFKKILIAVANFDDVNTNSNLSTFSTRQVRRRR